MKLANARSLARQMSTQNGRTHLSAWSCMPFAVRAFAPMQTVPLPLFAVLHCLQKQFVTAMLCMHDSGVPLASDQSALYKTLSRLFSFFSSTLLFFCLQKLVVQCDAVYAGQWCASGQGSACSMSRLLLFFIKAFLFFRVQNQTLSLMFCMQDSVVSVARDQACSMSDSSSSSSRHSSSSVCRQWL